MTRQVPVHYLRPNEAVWTPPTVAYFDTETRTVMDGDDEILCLRLWCAEVVRRRKSAKTKPDRSEAQGTTSAELLAWLEEITRGERTVWVYAHNLAFDLTTTRLVVELVNAGWHCTEFSITGKSPWFRFAKGTKRLLFTDSWSWLPEALGAIGKSVKVRKPALPAEDDSEAAWLKRCRTDVRILSTAIGDLLDWWDRAQLGRWTITGAACGWNVMRHMIRSRIVVVDPDEDARTFERQAIRGGRRDSWRYGTFRAGPYLELDFRSAHPTIAANCLLPAKRLHPINSLPLDHPMWRTASIGVIADATVTTSEPRYPVRVGNHNYFPTGTFRTTLAWPELKMARERGELHDVGRGYAYKLDGHLQEWAEWCLRLAAGQLDDAPKVAQIAGRHWSRSVIGKWAAKGSTVIPLGPALHSVWHVEDGYDVETASTAQLVDVGDRSWWVIHDQENDNSFPAVLAFIESELRVRLARVIDTLGPALALSCDTDGLIVDGGLLFTPNHRHRLRIAEHHSARTAARSLCRRLSRLTAPLTLRLKGEYDHIVILGPQQMELGDKRRMSGLRADAKLAIDGAYESRSWPRLPWQMQHGDPRGYLRPLVRTRIQGTYIPRWYLGDGSLFPPAAGIDSEGRSYLIPFSELSPRPRFDIPALVQHPGLRKVAS